jgi:hypothetical protein
MANVKLVGLLSRQRHDYANHLQVIKGYLELGLPERAKEYVDVAAQELAEASRLFNCTPPDVTIPIYELQLWTRDRGISLRIGDVRIDGAADLVLSQGLTALRQILEDLAVPAGGEEFEVWLDMVEGLKQIIIRLRWSGESGQVMREIVLTR